MRAHRPTKKTGCPNSSMLGDLVVSSDKPISNKICKNHKWRHYKYYMECIKCRFHLLK